MEPTQDNEISSIDQDLEAVRSAWASHTQAEPPRLLDQAVLNAARRELEKSRRLRPGAWLGAVATAAVVVLALTIVLQQHDQAPAPAPSKADGIQLERSALSHDMPEPAPASAAPAAAPRPQRQEALEAVADSAATVSPELRETGENAAKSLRAVPSAPLEDAAVLEPEAWIAVLRRLQKEGRADELRSELEAFRTAWPDYPLPPDLLD